MGVILVTGAITAREQTYDEVLRLSRKHVQRSRAEPGCLSHDVYVDIDEPLRLVFIEQWVDRDALLAHFSVPASSDFVQQVSVLAAAPPTLEVWAAEPVTL